MPSKNFAWMNSVTENTRKANFSQEKILNPIRKTFALKKMETCLPERVRLGFEWLRELPHQVRGKGVLSLHQW